MHRQTLLNLCVYLLIPLKSLLMALDTRASAVSVLVIVVFVFLVSLPALLLLTASLGNVNVREADLLIPTCIGAVRGGRMDSSWRMHAGSAHPFFGKTIANWMLL